MAWIATVEPSEAKGDLQDIFEAIASARGGIADVHRVQSLNPRAIRAHLDLYKAVVFQKSTLSRIMRERIGVIVSASNGCRYCVRHHAEALRALNDEATIIDALGEGEVPDELPPAEIAMLRWAKAGAVEPARSTEAEVRDLRAHGFDDRAILDAALTTGYFSFVNRLVLLLGVHVEPDLENTCRRVEME
ncbi:MAG: peroxidase-related enzyme [Acidobacteriota bacterium]